MGSRMEKADEAEAKQGASILVLGRDSVLMVKRANEPFAGLWSFPGGRVEPGEGAEEAGRRELLEETGLAVGEAVRLGTKEPEPGSSFRLAVFAAHANEGSPVAGDDALDAAFVPFSAVLERPTTSKAASWIARAIAALVEQPHQ